MRARWQSRASQPFDAVSFGDRRIDDSYEEMARRAHRPVTTLRSDVARLRKRYRAILREIVRDTVFEAAEVDEELRYLCRVLTAAFTWRNATRSPSKRSGRRGPG